MFSGIEMLRSQLFVGLTLQEVLVLKSVRCYNAVMELEEDMGKMACFNGESKRRYNIQFWPIHFRKLLQDTMQEKSLESLVMTTVLATKRLCAKSILPFHSILLCRSHRLNKMLEVLQFPKGLGV